MANAPDRRLSEQEYLEIERGLETKNEFYLGKMFAMSGASRKHIVITGNIASEIHQQFKDRKCEVYQADMRVKVSPTGLYTYPDVVALCHEPKFEDAAVDTLLNPQVIIEVASKSTEQYDRRIKFAHYKTLDSLQVYIMVSQEQPVVERFIRQPDGQWLLWIGDKLSDELIINCIGCKLRLSDIYARIEFDELDQFQVREPYDEKYLASRPSI